VAKRTFDEELAMFERQVWDEIQHRTRLPEETAGRASSGFVS
jgi:hypothetical protein